MSSALRSTSIRLYLNVVRKDQAARQHDQTLAQGFFDSFFLPTTSTRCMAQERIQFKRGIYLIDGIVRESKIQNTYGTKKSSSRPRPQELLFQKNIPFVDGSLDLDKNKVRSSNIHVLQVVKRSISFSSR
jgi:hypothetical protein